MIKRLIGLIVLVIALLGGLVVPASADPDTKNTTPCAADNAADPGCGDVSVYGTDARALAAEIATEPTPPVDRIPVDEKLLYARPFRKVIKIGPVYDAPNGNVIGKMDDGFQFVNAGRVVNGFVEIRTGQWIPEDALGPMNKSVSHFSGVTIRGGMPSRPFAWMLLDTRPSRTPGTKPLRETPEIKRYTLVNIYAIQVVDTWEWYLIGPDQWVVQTKVAKVKPVKRPDEIKGGKWVAVDLFEQTLVAYDDNTPVYATLVSTGLPKWTTDEGVTKIWDRHVETKMSGGAGQPEFWFLPQVPYVMYFNKSNQALHGAYWHDGFGFRHSRGCVNLSITDAKWIFDWTTDAPDAYVYVYHSAEYRPNAPQ